MSRLGKLNLLDLSHNRLSAVPTVCRRLTTLRQLLLDENILADTTSCTGLRSLRLLSLVANNIQHFSTDRGLYLLESLDLRRNALSEVSAGELVAMPFLFALDLSHNSLTSVPQALEKLTVLTDLNLSNNKIASLECSFAPLVNLTRVNLSHNALDSTTALQFSDAADLTELKVCFIFFATLFSCMRAALA